MNINVPQKETWQGWLEAGRHGMNAESWSAFVDSMTEEGLPFWEAGEVYTQYLFTHLCCAMFLACLQAAPADVEKILADIAHTARSGNFSKSSRGMKGEKLRAYRHTASLYAQLLPANADMLEAIFLHYVRGEYDMGVNPNLLIQQARQFMVVGKRDQALHLLAQAGAAALRGAPMWHGWLNEAPEPFNRLALPLMTLAELMRLLQPITDVAGERLRVGERVATLSTWPASQPQTDLSEFNQDMMTLSDDDISRFGSQAFMDDFFEMLQRAEPLDDDEIRQMGRQYSLLVKFSMRILEYGDDIPEEFQAPDSNVVALAAEVLGTLRYADQSAIDLLVDRLAFHETEMEQDTSIAAEGALMKMGPAILDFSFDFVRYSSRDHTRPNMLRVLAVVGRGNENVFDFLAQQFNATDWASGKLQYALPLALTHDPRAVPMVVAALRHPTLDEDDAWELLDALQELDVTFYVNHDKHAVNIPDYGVIEDVLPEDWKTRKEIDEEEDEDDAASFDSYGDDEDDEDWDDEVVYDDEGTPRCPDCGEEMHFIAGRWQHQTALTLLTGTSPEVDPYQDALPNDPCPCGSGRKFKNCHGKGQKKK